MELLFILGMSFLMMVGLQIFIARKGSHYTRAMGDAHWQAMNENIEERAERRRKQGFRE